MKKNRAGFAVIFLTMLPGAALSGEEGPKDRPNPSPYSLSPVPRDGARATTGLGLDLPPDADPKADQREHVRQSRYLTRAGVLAPLPAPGEHQAEGAGVPGMTRHEN